MLQTGAKSLKAVWFSQAGKSLRNDAKELHYGQCRIKQLFMKVQYPFKFLRTHCVLFMRWNWWWHFKVTLRLTAYNASILFILFPVSTEGENSFLYYENRYIPHIVCNSYYMCCYCWFFKVVGGSYALSLCYLKHDKTKHTAHHLSLWAMAIVSILNNCHIL